MPVGALLAALERDADAEACRCRSEAQQRAEQLIAAAAAAVNRRRGAVLDRLALSRKAELARQAAEATRVLKGQVLETRAALLNQVFDEARQRLSRLDSPRWADRIPHLVEQILCYLDPGHAVLVCPPETEPAVRRVIGRRRVSLEVRKDAAAGLLGRTPDGTVVVDNTLVARLERLRPDLAIRLLDRVEGRTHAVG